MKRLLLIVGMAAALMMAWSLERVQGQQAQASKVVFASPDQAKFTEVGKGSSMAPIWGDANMEAHATFTKFEPGFDAGTAFAPALLECIVPESFSERR